MKVYKSTESWNPGELETPTRPQPRMIIVPKCGRAHRRKTDSRKLWMTLRSVRPMYGSLVQNEKHLKKGSSAAVGCSEN